jgi:hypothetical protein
MEAQRSNSYEQLQKVFEGYEPDHPVTTHMVIGGLHVSGDSVQRELDNLKIAADSFQVLVTTTHDEVENEALVALAGPAGQLAKVAVTMAMTTVGTAAGAR